MRRSCAVLLFAVVAWAQNAPPATPASRPEPDEAQQLSMAISEAGNSPVDFIRNLEKHLAKYQKDPEAAKLAIHNGESQPDPKLPEPELAAWTLVANLLLNLDETLNKN